MSTTVKSFLQAAGFTGLVVLIFGFIILGAIHTNRQEKTFKSDCVAVQGHVVYDDNELECHKNGFEIAEFGENSPRDPVWNDRVN